MSSSTRLVGVTHALKGTTFCLASGRSLNSAVSIRSFLKVLAAQKRTEERVAMSAIPVYKPENV